MYDWTSIENLSNELDFEDYRDLIMCCPVIEHTEAKDLCGVCGGAHLSVERRIRCFSISCGARAACPVILTVHHCSASDTWVVLVNGAAHGRAALPCFGEHPTRVTLSSRRRMTR